MCSECEVGMWEEEQICPTCCRNSRYGERHKYCRGDLEGLTCLWAYEGIARKLITRAKYSGQFDVLEFLISNFQFSNKPEMFKFSKFIEMGPVMVPVPLYPKRERERGFNQAEIVSQVVAKLVNLRSVNLLIRIKDTGRQVGRERKLRLEVMSGAFNITPRPPLNLRWGANILLVDDVWTTGATLRECAKVLKKAGVDSIWGLVLAR